MQPTNLFAIAFAAALLAGQPTAKADCNCLQPQANHDGAVGTTCATTPPAHSKAKRVPALVIQRQAIYQPQPRLPEMFKLASRGKQGLAGTYRICVGANGKVFEVAVIKGVP